MIIIFQFLMHFSILPTFFKIFVEFQLIFYYAGTPPFSDSVLHFEKEFEFINV